MIGSAGHAFSSTNVVQFAAAGETVSQSQGSFHVPVQVTGTPAVQINNLIPANVVGTVTFDPVAVAIDAAGHLYVSNIAANTVMVFDTAGHTLDPAFGGGAIFAYPVGLAFDSAGNLYVANQNYGLGGGAINVLNPSGQVLNYNFGGNANIYAPTGLAFDASGNLYVADAVAGQVYKLSPYGDLISSNFGGAAANYVGPTGLAFDAAGNLYVSDGLNNHIIKLDPAGNVVDSDFGDQSSVYTSPAGLAFDPAGNLYVAYGMGLNQISPSGVVLNQNLGATLKGIVFDAAGNLYAAIGAVYIPAMNGNLSQLSSMVSVPFTLGGTAVAGTDYANVTASPLSFGIAQSSPGVFSGLITGQLLTTPSTGKTLTFTLGTPIGGTLGATTRNTLTISSAPPALFSGSFQGLVLTGNLATSSAASVALSAGGGFSLSLKTGASSLSAKGALDPSGHALLSIPRKGASSLTVTLALDLTGSSSITVADGTTTTVNVLYPVTNIAKTASAGMAGAYTLLVPPPANGTGLPMGYGSAAMTVSSTGKMKLAGKLGDGTAFTAGANLLASAASAAPDSFILYTPLAAAPAGQIYGRFTFSPPATGNFAGGLQWYLPAQTKPGPFKSGFELALPAAGSIYTAPAKGAYVLGLASGNGNASVTLSGGNLSSSLTNTLSIAAAPKNTVTVSGANSDALKLTITAATGAFTGSFTPSGAKKPIALSGVFSQSQQIGAGVFVGSTESGAIVISP